MAAARRRRPDARRLASRILEREVRKLTLRAWQALTSATPVDTGFARAGWSPSVGSPDPGPEKPDGSQRGPRQAQAAALFSQNGSKASSIASSYSLGQGTVFIVNNVRYVRFLNEGSSAQAPAMFVERALATAVAATRRALGS